MTIKKQPILNKKLGSKKSSSKASCGCIKKAKKSGGKKCDPKKVKVEKTKTFSDNTIIKKLNKPIRIKKVKTIGNKRATTTYVQSTRPVSGGGDGWDVDTLGVVLGPDVSLGKIQISESLYISRAKMNAITVCGLIREYSCLRGVAGRRFCTLEHIRTQRCNWTRTGAISISTNITIPAIFNEIYNNNSSVRSCITDKTSVIKDYILNNIGTVSKLDYDYYYKNVTRIQIEAILEYQTQLKACLSSFLNSDEADALANGIRVSARVLFQSNTAWARVS